MLGTSDPNLMVAGWGTGLLLLAVVWRLIEWVREAPSTPDPWDAEVQRQLEQPEAREVCPHCFHEQEPAAWFCGHCGRAVGPYNNLMPFINVFSEGEVLRNGVSGRFRNRPLVLIGYFLISLVAYSIFAPIFWFFVLANRKPSQNEPEPVAGDQEQR